MIKALIHKILLQPLPRAPMVLGLMVLLLLARAPAVAQQPPPGIVYEGQSTTLAVETHDGVTYLWDLYHGVAGLNFATTPGNCPIARAYFVGGVNHGASVEVTWVMQGVYFFKATANDGCTNNLKVGKMEVIPYSYAELCADPAPVCSGDTAVFTLCIPQGVGPWDVTFTNGIDVIIEQNIQQSPHVFQLVPTPLNTSTNDITYNYWVTSVTDGYGTVSDSITAPVSLTVYPLPDIPVCPTYGPFCWGDDPVEFTGFEGVFTYNGTVVNGWNPNNAGEFKLIYTVTDPETGCQSHCDVIIIVHPLPEVNCPPNFAVCCTDDPILLSDLAKGPAGGVFYLHGQEITHFVPHCNSTGYFDFTYVYTDENGCKNSCKFTITVVEKVIADAGPSQRIRYQILSEGEGVNVVTAIMAANNPHPSTGTWTLESWPANQLVPTIVNPSSQNTRVVWYGIGKGLYIFRWTIENYPCDDSFDEMAIDLMPRIHIADGFTPDYDGDGDTWQIGGLEHYPGHVVRVYNHLGTLVFEASPYDKPWDGVATTGRVVSGKGQKLPAGVYFYVIILDQGMSPISGSLHLFY